MTEHALYGVSLVLMTVGGPVLLISYLFKGRAELILTVIGEVLVGAGGLIGLGSVIAY